MIKLAIDLHKNKTQQIRFISNKLFIDTAYFYGNYNISNYTKHIYSEQSFVPARFQRIIKKIIISNGVTKYENKNSNHNVQQILPNSIIYYINNSYENKIKIKTNNTQNNKHIIYSFQWITQKYYMHTIFLQIVQINTLKNTMQNFLINETKKIIVDLCNNTQIKKLYFYDCSKLTIDVSINSSITNMCVSRGMHYISIKSKCLTTKKIIFHDITKILKKYFIYKIYLYDCEMIDEPIQCKTYRDISLNCDIITACKRNYNFLRNTYEFKICNSDLNLTNIKNYYHLLFVKKITIKCNIVCKIDYIKIMDHIICPSLHYCSKIKKLFFSENKQCSSSTHMCNYENKYYKLLSFSITCK